MSGYIFGLFLSQYFGGTVPLWVYAMLGAVIAVAGALAVRDYRQSKRAGL